MINIHHANDFVFMVSIAEGYKEMISFLIFDYKIEETKAIKDFISKRSQKDQNELIEMFNSRNEKIKLNNLIKNNNAASKSFKKL